MKKIPLSPEPAPTDAVAPRFLLEALETLGLGGLGLFALLWWPFFQQMLAPDAQLAAVRVHGLVSLALAVVLLIMSLNPAAQSRRSPWPRVLLGANGVAAAGLLAWCAGLVLASLPGSASILIGAQAVLGLGYFVVTRVMVEGIS